MEEVLIPLIFFSCVFGVLYVFFTTRNKERLALIEKGADATLFKSGPSKNTYGVVVFYIALLSIGIGTGVLLGNLLGMSGMDEDVAYPSMIFICGGVGLLAAFFISRKMNPEVKE